MKLILVRHAQSYRNAKIESSSNQGLTEIGTEQARRLGKFFHQLKINKVYCSTLNRAKETFEQIKPYLKNTPVTFTANIVEHKMGIYEDGKYDQMNEYKEEAKKQKIDLYDFKPPKGDSFKETFKRANEFYKKLLLSHSNDTVLIIGHGFFNTAIILVALNLPIEEEKYFKLSNASVSTLDIDKRGKVRKYHINDYHHLIQEAIDLNSR